MVAVEVWVIKRVMMAAVVTVVLIVMTVAGGSITNLRRSEYGP